jgi:hypothetical protein
MKERRRTKLTPNDLPKAVKNLLTHCQTQLAIARRDGHAELVRDLSAAVGALELIHDELHGVCPQRPREQRSAAFTRYAIDEGDSMVLDQSLVTQIVEIEGLYKRL